MIRQPCILISPSEAVIGFDPSEYTTTEEVDQFANLNNIIRVLSGQLGRDVVVVLNTQSGTATSKTTQTISMLV